MKISELQELLEKAKEEHGDIDVVYYDAGRYHYIFNGNMFHYKGEPVLELE